MAETSNQNRLKKYIVITSLSLAGFSALYISIMLKGIVTNILDQIDNTFYTQFLSIRERLNENAQQIESDIVIVGIDDRTLNKLGAYNPQTYRRYHVDALANIVDGKPAVVAYDILFGDPHDDASVDRNLARAMKQGPVFSVLFGTARDKSDGKFTPFSYQLPGGTVMNFIEEAGFEMMALPVLHAITGAGFANAYPDKDGLIRKMPVFFKVGNKLYPTIAFELYRHLIKISKEGVRIKKRNIFAGTARLPVDDHCRLRIDIDKKYQIRELSFYDVYKGRVPGLFFKDKIIFIASTATGLGDNKLVPLYGYINGVRIHANLLLNFMNNNLIYDLSGGLYFLLVFLTSLFYTYVYYSRRELSTVKRIMGYISNVGLVTKATETMLKISPINRLVQTIKTSYLRHYGLRLFFLLFSEARKRVEPILLHLILLYLALFLTFYFFRIFIRPSAFVIQLFIANLIVSEFNRIDFEKISVTSQTKDSHSA